MSTESNPYQTPGATLGYGEVRSGPEVVSRWRRFFGYLIDMVCIQVVFAGFALVGFGQFAFNTAQTGVSFQWGGTLLLRYLELVFFYIVFEATLRRTPGKFVCGTKVVTDENGIPSFKQILGRSFARLIPFEGFAIFGAGKLTWHDKLSDTRVVRAR